MIPRFLLALGLLSCLPVTSQNAQQVALCPYENSDAYDVYDAVLSTNADTSPLVIFSETIDGGMCLKPEGASQRVLMPAVIDYNKQAQQSYRLQPKFKLKRRYELLSHEEIKARFKKPGEGGWVELSAVGFNRKRTVAVVWVYHGCPGLCGNGTFQVLHKKDGKWQPLEWKGTNCVVAS